MKILYINNDGAGFADYIEIESDTSVGSFFDDRCKGKPSDFLIRVNRQPVAIDYVLRDGDRVSITPTKIEGAVPLNVGALIKESGNEPPAPWRP